MNVLIVDDSQLARALLCKALTHNGIDNIDMAEGGREALQKIEENNYDIIFLDSNMPGLNGLQVIQDIRANGHEMPIVMISVESDEEKIRQAMEWGASAYLKKPFTPQEFEEMLKKIQ